MSDGARSFIELSGVVIVAAISSLTTYATTRRSAKAPERSADADIQDKINAGFSVLAARYEARDKTLTDHITALTDEIHELTRHVENLETVLRQNGINVPHRHPRAPLLQLASG